MKYTTIIALTLASLAAGCDLEVGDLNNLPESELQDEPTPTLVNLAATGLLAGSRLEYGFDNGYIAHLSVLGREAYNLDVADPRYRAELLSGPGLDPGSPAFGGNLWNDPYANIHNALNVLNAVGKVDAYSEQEREGLRGFAKTIEALDYFMIVNTRDVNGGFIATSTDIDVLPTPASKDELHEHIASLLDQGAGHLDNAGDAFTFTFSSGYAGFDTPSSFRSYNRALRARVAAYQEDWDGVLSALADSFLDTSDTASMNLGVYHSFSTQSGDITNQLVSNNLYGHPTLATDVDPDDQRFAQKLAQVDSRTLDGLTSDLQFTVYDSTSAPVPIIRNEELLLLSAEAKLRTGDLAGAVADLNIVRQQSAGQDALVADDLDADAVFEELVYQRRFGLLFEGHRWIDMRRWGLIEQLPLDREGDVVHTEFPIPTPEQNARL
ncbi:RagB/SusD family nutrient uptake outer membrane protein [Haliangium ochraceum]|uniref:Putative lipoprotein n=1 Tax=Haliangium ochraceum (strain DSM 14365 / JCM 11303 / SMP-2) TaxID=502025 RepID=D0LLA6_HALO1|nr:RagB/SusD family nutrient uptake outer membrane protein [Haliangium ochraceum]ACY18602.1 putative lipoprotein [Haliangium ochraceum DSM 14365]